MRYRPINLRFTHLLGYSTGIKTDRKLFRSSVVQSLYREMYRDWQWPTWLSASCRRLSVVLCRR